MDLEEFHNFLSDMKTALLEKRATLDSLLQHQGDDFLYVKRELSKVNFALKRIKENQYGLCINCGVPIERDLLEVQPESIICLQCIKDTQAN